MKRISTDICVIGGGSAGLSFAAGAAQMGAKVVLFEAGKMGGDCLNTGCVPSKALLAAAKAAHRAHGMPAMGITSGPPTIDFRTVKRHVADVIAQIAPHDSIERFTSLGVTVISQRARFVTRNSVESATYQVQARFFVIATGSRPLIPPIKGLETVPFHTNETLFTDPEKPAHLLVIGGGPIGIEMAQAHRRLGCAVTVIEAASILRRDNPDLVAILRQQLADAGITLIEGTGVSEVRGKAGEIRVTLDDGRNLNGSHLLVAAGRQPELGGLELAKAGVNHGPAGITTDQRLRTSNRRIYAIGDVTGRAQFTHVASYHAGIAIRNILFKLPAKVNDSLLPWVTYTDPELAHVGLDLAMATARYGAAQIRTIEVPMARIDRAIAEGQESGRISLVLHRNGRILGASILAPHAGEMILAWGLAISSSQKIGKMANVIVPYPTYGDASKQAAGRFFTEKLFSPMTRRLVRLLLRF